MDGERSNDNDPTLPYVSDVDDDTNPTQPHIQVPETHSSPMLELVWDDDSDDDDPSYLEFLRGRSNLPALEDRREQTLLQVMMASREVVKDASSPMHQEVSHYLVEKDILDMLREALISYTNANEDFIGTVDGIDATSTTKEM